MFRLETPVQHYAWGSASVLPDLLGADSDGRPWAELWMGAHPGGPAGLRDEPGGRTLADLLDEEGGVTVGPRVRQEFGERLPYLFKVLAVGRPCSLQVHPDRDQAGAGFAREEAAGIALTAPERCFKDREHKPEMVVALTRFEALCGFREPRRVRELLDGLDAPLAAGLRERLGAAPTVEGLRDAFASLLLDPPSEHEVGSLAAACAARLAAGSASTRAADGTVVGLAQWYPGDPGAAASLFLHRVTLQPGEALFVPAGVLHAYLEGTALEVMACSDNVLRAGLTGKHIDVPALLDITRHEPTPPHRTAPEPGADGTVVYRAPAREIALALTTGDPGRDRELPDDGPRIVLCLAGSGTVRTGAGSLDVARGDAVLLTDADGPAQLRGAGTLATAFVPASASAGPGDERNTSRR